jgi:MarR family
MANWSFLTSHARVLLCIARDPGARLRDIAARLGITERSAYGIVTELAGAGYVVKQKDGRRNRYQIQAHLPLPVAASREPASQIWGEPAPVYARGIARLDRGRVRYHVLWPGGRACPGARAAAGPCHRGELRLMIAAAQVRRVFELVGADRIVSSARTTSPPARVRNCAPGRRRWPAGPGRGWSAAPGSSPARLTILELYC